MRKQRPANDRNSDELKSWELPGTESNQPASCPLLATAKLLPIRYGRVEVPPEGKAAGMPYELKSRPLGYRLLREGYIYILDESAESLDEYVFEDGTLSGHNEGKLEYPLDHVLYACFTEVRLTDKKKAQVLDSQSERAHFMQKIDLPNASPVSGGEHLLTLDQASQWVAEFAEDYEPEMPDGGNPQEYEPYYWENQPYYHKTRLGKLLSQQEIEDPSDCLCIVLRDDVGVMLDLAQHQNDVVGWLEEWTLGPDGTRSVERDYMLGTIIESITVMDDAAVIGFMRSHSDSDVQSMISNLNELQQDEQARTISALTDWLNTDSDDGRGIGATTQSHPTELKAQLDKIREDANRANYLVIADRLNQVTEDYYTRRALASVEQGFVDEHIEAIKKLKKQHNANLRNTLNGVGFGKQGINDLIDRPGMNEFMQAQREKLARWQTELALVTEDRTSLIADSRFQSAAWYFDPDDEGQVGSSLMLEYQCLKDVCRTDEAAEKIAEWMEQEPQYSRPMFYTLPLSEQVSGAELVTTYASITSAGYGIVTRAKEYSESLFKAEAGRLPALESMSEEIRLNAAAIGDALSPAISLSIASTMEDIYRGLDADRMPSLDEIFRNLSFFLKGKLLEAARSGRVEFRLASAEELEEFKVNLHKIMQLNEQISDVNSEHDKVKSTHGHRSETAKQLVDQFHSLRDEQRLLGERLAAALSPIDESDPRISLAPPDAANGKAAVSIILSAAADQREVGRVVQSIRSGAPAVPAANALGDGIGVAIFFVQLANFGGALEEFIKSKNAFGSGKNSFTPVVEAFAGSSAAGLACAQGIVDSALGARAQQLANAWKGTELKGVHAQMGRMHAFLGGFAYVTGFIASGFSINKHRSNWLDAVKAGNQQAEYAAITAMIGSGGLAATNTVGAVSSLSAWRQVASAGREAAQTLGGDVAKARATAWAATGPRLASLFARLNLFGLAFTVIELGSTWYYNYNTRSQLDEWISSTPWSNDPRKKRDHVIDDYLAALEQTRDWLTLTRAGKNDDGRQGFHLNFYGLPADALKKPITGAPSRKVSLACWLVQPEAGWWVFSRDPETWVRAMAPMSETLWVNEQADFLRVGFFPPKHQKTEHGRETSELALMVKIESLHTEERYTGSVYMLRIKPDSEFPLLPVQEAPVEPAVWWELDWPFVPIEAVA